MLAKVMKVLFYKKVKKFMLGANLWRKSNIITLTKNTVPSNLKTIEVKVNQPLPKGEYTLTISNSKGKTVGSAIFKVYEEFDGIIHAHRTDTDDSVFIFLVLNNNTDNDVEVEFEVSLPPEARVNSPLLRESKRLKRGSTSMVLSLDKSKYGNLSVPLTILVRSKEELIKPVSGRDKVKLSYKPIGTSTRRQKSFDFEKDRVKEARLAGLFTDRAGTY